MRNARGFTLVELVITLLVLAILVTLAIPSFRDYTANQRVRTAAVDLMTTLNHARSEAVKRNQTIDVAAATGGWSNGWAVSSAGTVLLSRSPHAKVTISTDGGATALSFQRSGRASAGTTFTICDTVGSAAVRGRHVTLSHSGVPAIEEPNDAVCS